MEARKNLDKEEIEAVKELIRKLPPEDLEKAAGGISLRSKDILASLGALAIVTTSVMIMSGKLGGSGGNIGGSTAFSTANESQGEKLSDDKAKEMIKKYNISDTLVKAVSGDRLYPHQVFNKNTYLTKNNDGTFSKNLKANFVSCDGRIYHKKQTKNRLFFGTTIVEQKEAGKGVPIGLLKDLGDSLNSK